MAFNDSTSVMWAYDIKTNVMYIINPPAILNTKKHKNMKGEKWVPVSRDSLSERTLCLMRDLALIPGPNMLQPCVDFTKCFKLAMSHAPSIDEKNKLEFRSMVENKKKCSKTADIGIGYNVNTKWVKFS